MIQSLDAAMRDACRAVGIVPPPSDPVPGRWVRTNTRERNGKGDASVLLFDDERGGIAWNWQTQQQQVFRLGRDVPAPRSPKRDPEKARREKEDARAVLDTCARIVYACRHDVHPYLVHKGFPTELGLVLDDVRSLLPSGPLGEAMGHAMPDGGPFLIVPGWIGRGLTTVQVIAADGTKRNLKYARIGGASHRIATGPRAVVCEGIATALSVRAALRLLSIPATVLCAFAANNVAAVAADTGAFICADHDKPINALAGLGTGEFYARQSGCQWSMPPEMGDYNDWHQREGLRAVALHLREVLMG